MPTSKETIYEQLPPYDIEEGTEEGRAEDETTNILENDPLNTSTDVSLLEIEQQNLRSSKFTKLQCCQFALAYVVTVAVTILGVVFILAYFHYLTKAAQSKAGNTTHN